MPTRLDMIINLIQEEAREKTGLKDYVSKLYDVQLEVDHRVGMIMKVVRDHQRQAEKKKGGG